MPFTCSVTCCVVCCFVVVYLLFVFCCFVVCVLLVVCLFLLSLLVACCFVVCVVLFDYLVVVFANRLLTRILPLCLRLTLFSTFVDMGKHRSLMLNRQRHV